MSILEVHPEQENYQMQADLRALKLQGQYLWFMHAPCMYGPTSTRRLMVMSLSAVSLHSMA